MICCRARRGAANNSPRRPEPAPTPSRGQVRLVTRTVSSTPRIPPALRRANNVPDTLHAAGSRTPCYSNQFETFSPHLSLSPQPFRESAFELRGEGRVRGLSADQFETFL